MNKTAFNLINSLGKPSLGISRKIMPQVKSIPSLVKNLGAPSMKIKIKASALNPSQSFIDSKKVENFKGRAKDILISNDGHVIDGHHRWAKAMVDNKKINAVIVDMPAKQLINKANEFTKTALSKGFKLNALHDTLFRSNARLYDIEKAISKTHEILKKTPDNKIAEIMSEANLYRKVKRQLKINPNTNLPFGQSKVESRFVSSANLTPDQMNSTELARLNKVARLAFKDELSKIS